MATAMKSPSKTGFVKEFLIAHPEANTRAVNEAWRAAGNKDSIGDSLIYHLKSEMKRGGNRRGNTLAADPAPGKAGLTSEFLKTQPESAARKVNDASKAAGMKRQTSPAVNGRAKASRERAGTPRGKSTATTTGKGPGTPPSYAAAAIAGTPVAPHRDGNAHRTSALLDVEAAIDHLLYTVMGIGDLAEIEAALRSARRKVYGAMSS